MDIDQQFENVVKVVDKLARTTSQQGEAISNQGARLDAVENTLRDIALSLKELTHNVHKPINITAWISISISAVVLAAVYLEARFDPVEKLAERAVAWTDNRDALLQSDYVLWGRQGAKIEHNFSRVHELSEEADKISERVSTIEGELPLVIKQLDAVDNNRSRGWNDAALQN